MDEPGGGVCIAVLQVPGQNPLVVSRFVVRHTLEPPVPPWLCVGSLSVVPVKPVGEDVVPEVDPLDVSPIKT